MTIEEKKSKAYFIISQAKENRYPYLNLRGLGLYELPADITDMPYLLEIDISHNNFLELPHQIANLENLQILNCSYNHLRDFTLIEGKPYFFKRIDISNNLLSYIPKELLFLDTDVEIIYNENFFSSGLPPEISEYGDLSYLSFYLESLERKEIQNRLFETKLLIVGKGEVGKTSLMKIIKNQNCSVSLGSEKPTEGIDISSTYLETVFPAKKPYYNRIEDFDSLLKFSTYDAEDFPENYGPEYNNYESIFPFCYEDEELLLELRVNDQPYFDYNFYVQKDIKLNIWDFGGQEILYSTHQFFLTQRSIYIFVWEPRSDTETESFDYWLNIIKRLSNNSPVLIVMNKSDLRFKNVDENSYKNQFPNIKGFHTISCLSKEGIPLLLNQIEETIQKLPHIGDLLPNSWNEIRHSIKSLNNDYIQFDEFRKLCKLKEDKKVNYLSSYLTDLGDIIHFQDDILLSNLVILKPNWLTEAIYSLIHSKVVQSNLGTLELENLPVLLNENKYPKNKHLEIISLMEKFEICFKIIGSKNIYIIPALLPAQPMESFAIGMFQTAETIKLNIQYKFLPSGLIERLICKMKNFIVDRQFWKYGLIIQDEYSKALIKLKAPEREISIDFIGDLNPSLLQIIQFQLNDIHTTLRLDKEDYQIFLACNCYECSSTSSPHMFNKSVLKRFLDKDKRFIECQISTEKVNINELMMGYKSPDKPHSLIRPFVQATSTLQGRISLLKESSEDDKNRYLLDLLKPHLSKHHLVGLDQAQRGFSSTRKRSGELDIAIEDISGTPMSLFEGFHLDYLNKGIIDSHINKTISNYDVQGLKEKFLGIYCLAKDFPELVNKYKLYLDSLENMQNTIDMSSQYSNGQEIQIFRSVLKKYKKHTYLYHILINFNL